MNYDTKIGTVDEQDAPSVSGPFDEGGEDDDRLITRRMLVIGAVALVALIGLWFLNRFEQPGDLSASAQVQTPVVTVIVPGKATVTGEINATGTLAARRELPVGVVGDGGRIVKVLVEPGQWVEAGQVLARIDRSVQDEQAASLAAQVSVAQADARLAQANLDRSLKLVDRGFISQADVDRLTSTRDGAVARVRVARAQLAEMQARNRRLDIVAPAAGLLLERKVEPGQVVSPGTGVLFSIAKGGEMELLADLGEDDLARISVGSSAQVTPVGTNKVFTGQVWQISPVIDAKTRQGTARIALSYAPELRPGGFASARITAGSVVAPKLPESAVLVDDKGSYVFIVGKDNKVEKRAVKTGTLTADGMAVTQGLSGSEKVVLRAGAFLQPGETVRPKIASGD